MSSRLGISAPPAEAPRDPSRTPSRGPHSNSALPSCGLLDPLQEAVEQVQAVVRAGSGLGVVLDGPAGDLEQLESLDGAVVEVDVRERSRAEVGLPAPRLVAVDRAPAARPERGEAVVLRGDLDAPGLQVADGMVGA